MRPKERPIISDNESSDDEEFEKFQSVPKGTNQPTKQLKRVFSHGIVEDGPKKGEKESIVGVVKASSGQNESFHFSPIDKPENVQSAKNEKSKIDQDEIRKNQQDIFHNVQSGFHVQYGPSLYESIN